MQRQAAHRNPDTLPYPEIDPDVREAMDVYLEYFISVATTALRKLSTIPKEDRPEWYENQIRYYKNIRSGFRKARATNNTTRNNRASTAEHSTETFDPAI